MLNPFIDVLSTVIRLYSLCIFIWVILSLLINFDIINRYQPFVRKVMEVLNKLIEPALRPIRRVLFRTIGDLGGIDLSPIVLLLGLQFIQSALFHWFYGL